MIKMYNIPTSVNDNYEHKRKANPLVFILFVLPISIGLFILGITDEEYYCVKEKLEY